MSQLPKPPDTFLEFTRRFPQVGKAWELLGDAGRAGPLDEKTARLIKVAIAVGCLREGAVHSAVRKAVAAGATRDEVEQVLALAASTLGLPATVAAYTWVRDVLAGPAGPVPTEA
ncbi:MAG TPA: carboxymuconolactone decarboxylase family protein [Gemmataceae bacterium]|jgi:alkylhydroperoxidase/carboxymuconolactone decarboxylase family protein YurZ